MTHMTPDYTDEPFCLVEALAPGSTYLVPLSEYSVLAHGPMLGLLETGWFCRLSAPGYLDCTDWTGPFPTRHEAEAFIRDTYNVDPDTGTDLDEAWEAARENRKPTITIDRTRL